MDLFKYNPLTDPTILERGEFINGLTSIMWTERYREPGEFKFETNLSSGLREFLPIGTLISHVDTLEVMIVENHEISETLGEDSKLTISGRSFESYLENRIVGVNLSRQTHNLSAYYATTTLSYFQAYTLINDHIRDSVSADDNLTNVVATVKSGMGSIGPVEYRPIDRGTVHERVIELLKITDCGIRTERRNTFGVVGAGSSTQTLFRVHRGDDKSASVIFSWKGGDLDSAEYLFSNKEEKNSALVVTKFLSRTVDLGPTKYNRRIMLVDAEDLDGHLSASPGEPTLSQIYAQMGTRGYQALYAQKPITISRADISSTSKYRYRRDYNIGDLVSLDGNFGAIAIMRVVEYVEIEDENGESGHPTLSLPGA